jgi:hypothetical protein
MSTWRYAMTKPVIDALDALLNIRAGMSDSQVMQKYNLSPKGLQSLFTKLVLAGAIKQSELDGRPHQGDTSVAVSGEAGYAYEVQEDRHELPTSITRAQAAVQDIRSGMSDSALMDKYQLSSKGLQTLFQQITASGAMEPSELDVRASPAEETVDVVEIIQKLGLDRTRAAEDAADVPRKCVACGAPQTAEYEECPVCGVNLQDYRAKKAREERMAQALWTCPACSRPQPKEFDECPVCGVIVSKYKKV